MYEPTLIALTEQDQKKNLPSYQNPLVVSLGESRGRQKLEVCHFHWEEGAGRKGALDPINVPRGWGNVDANRKRREGGATTEKDTEIHTHTHTHTLT